MLKLTYKLLVLGGILLLIAVIICLIMCSFAGAILTRNDLIEQKSYLVIFMGEPVERTAYAVSLYQRGLVEKIIFAKEQLSILAQKGYQLSGEQLTIQLLLASGVQENAITLINKVISSTDEEAQVICDYIVTQVSLEQPIVFVTSWYHTRRAFWSINRYCGQRQQQFKVSAAPYLGILGEKWWQNEESFLAVFIEYLKWMYYLRYII